MINRYEVHSYTWIDGWINMWYEDEQPAAFASIEEAEEEIEIYLAQTDSEIQSGTCPPIFERNKESFRIYDRIAQVYVRSSSD